jgi:sugar transferase EpsL
MTTPVVSRPAARAVKRLVDVAGAATALVLLAPVTTVVALTVRLLMGRPVLFAQDRVGLGGATFRIYKFRTMADRYDDDGRPLPDEARITRFGRLLRSTSLDELPELVNVLKGDMSLVGPRPLFPEYLDHYTPTQRRRHDVRPGITGWCQVNGRNALSWEEKLDLDVWYVDNWSLRLDLRILALTPRAVMTRRGISASGHVTMPRFDESRSSRSE